MIETKNLTKRFRDITAVDHVTLKIQKGEIFGETILEVVKPISFVIPVTKQHWAYA